MRRKSGSRTKLPERMRAKTTSSGRTYYYYDHGYLDGKRKWTALGADYYEAVQKWSELECQPNRTVVTFRQALTAYYASTEFKEKATRTQKDYLSYGEQLLDFFDDPPAPLDAIEPEHVQRYHERRSETAKVRANREIALFSIVWNFARRFGYTSKANPKKGVRRNREDGRDVYVEDDAWVKVLTAADPVVRDTLLLAYLLGQRPADTFKIEAADVRGDVLLVAQGKTKNKLSVEMSPELQQVVTSCLARRTKLSQAQLLCKENGETFTYSTFQNRWAKLRKKLGIATQDFQFRDLRAKAGTDVKNERGYEDAQALLGHADVKTTQIYTRKRRGDKVRSTK